MLSGRVREGLRIQVDLGHESLFAPSAAWSRL